MDKDWKYHFGLCLKQMKLEREMRSLGDARVDKEILKAKQSERESETSYGAYLMSAVLTPLSKLVEAFVIKAFEGTPGPRAIAAVKMKELHPDTVAYLIVKTVLDSMSKNKMEQTVTREIGRAIEEECRFNFYHAQRPAFFDTIIRDHQKRKKQERWTKKVVQTRMEQTGVEWQSWSEQECIHLGEKGLALMLTCEFEGVGPLVKLADMAVRKHKYWKAAKRLVLAEGTEKLIEKCIGHNKLLNPNLLPTVMPPKQWHGPFGGGYWTNAVDRFNVLRLVKTRNTNYLNELRAVAMPQVFAALNAVQETAWRINPQVYAVITEAWDAGLEIGKVPSMRDALPPTKPHVVPPCKYRDDPDAYRAWRTTPDGRRWIAWRRMAAAVHERNARVKSRRLQVAKALWIAKMFKDEERFYFPYNLDFRSRLYSMPDCLNPQGPDYARALLTFADGLPITTPLHANWLAVHGANCYGIDKVSFHERVDWVLRHEADILRVAKDPLGQRVCWQDAENPWQFLAFCFEWAAFQNEGWGFVSSLPIALDGTCNGLQHFSAMLRDEIGGAAVNLIPAERPQDIYQRVADRTVEYLKADTDPMAAKWLVFGISRKLAKRPVMILPYGGTLYACRRYIREYLQDQIIDQHHENPFGDDLNYAVLYLSRHIWSAIGDVVVAARDAMTWLKKAAREITKKQLPIVWQTPVGFPVRQAYYAMKGHSIELALGRRVQRMIKVETDRLDPVEQVNGLSPNFVHSLDAAALMSCVTRCRRAGIKSFAMVHDSYGTTAAQTEGLAAALRTEFVNLYQNHDVLGELEAAIRAACPLAKIPNLPEKGELNIDAVLDSKFFFA